MFLLLCIFILGICIGSFLNVVIYRLPRELNMALPSSHCPHCQHTLKWFHNIPVFSYIFLKARCAFCHTKITWRYPLVELITGIITVFLFHDFGWSLIFVETALFSFILISLLFIDLEHQLLPDSLTLLLLWLGLLASIFPVFTHPSDAIIGAAAGYSSLWIIANTYQLITKREGMGYGDLKLLAALGAWTGWQVLPWIVLIAALLSAGVAIFLLVTKRANAKSAIAFGPYLAIAGWVVLLFGNPTFF